MTLRERIIVGLMVATVAYGGYAASRLMIRRSAPDARVDVGRTSDLREFAAAARLSVTATRPRPGEYEVLDKAAAPWKVSPFQEWSPPPAPVARPAVVAPVVPVFHYTGFVRQGEMRFAILNGHEYRAGEAVAPGDFMVVSVEPDRVVLAAKSGGRQMTVALERAEQKRGEP